MREKLGDIVTMGVKSQADAQVLMEKFIAVAQPSTVFGEPATSGPYTIITANEAAVTMGFGYGTGGGSAPQSAGAERAGAGPMTGEEESDRGMGFGGGGGGGGISLARPVAVITVGPGGVEVKPVMDLSKVALGFFTAFASMIIAASRIGRASRG